MFDIIRDNSIFFIAALSGAAVFLLILNVILFVLFFGLRKKMKIFFQGKDAKDLENVLTDLAKSAGEFKNRLDASDEKLSFIETLAKKGLHRVGVIRFNPFGGTGGDMSFCVAALNDVNDGFVLSGLYSREGVRVYAKPIERGASRYPLSEEEKQAIKRASGVNE